MQRCKKNFVLKFIIIIFMIFKDFNAQSHDSLLVKNNLIRVFIDCDICNNNVIKEEIPIVSYVRDPSHADVHLIIMCNYAANGGKVYNLKFIGLGKFANQLIEFDYNSPLSNPEINEQKGLAKSILYGLVPFISQTPYKETINISYNNIKVNNKIKTIDDNWYNWVFKISLRGFYEGEQTSKNINVGGSLNASKITDDVKLKNNLEYNYGHEEFIDEQNKIKSTKRSWLFESAYIKSITNHLSMGLIGSLNSSTYRNIKLSSSLFSGIEYNFFPWEKFNSEILTAGFYLGHKTFRYYNRTIFNKTYESLLFHSVKFEAEIKQNWGSFYGNLEFLQYPELDKKYRISFDNYLSFRLSEGLEFTVGFELERIHDQLYIAEGEATLEEILLKQKQLQTNYRYETSFGIRYTFGSIYNNVVNLRM